MRGGRTNTDTTRESGVWVERDTETHDPFPLAHTTTTHTRAYAHTIRTQGTARDCHCAFLMCTFGAQE